MNQTASLLNQAVSVSWTGATPTTYQLGQVWGNFLQIFQCWGDDDGTNPDNPGPSPEHCQFGGFQSNPKAASSLNLGSQFLDSRVVSSDGSSTYDPPNPTDGYWDQTQGLIWKPFEAVDGTVIKASANFSANNPYATGQGAYWRNGYFNFYTTNEIVVGRTYHNGTGSELMSLQTGLEAPGLGCGQKVLFVAGGPPVIPKCWMVIVPRSVGEIENPTEARLPNSPLATSPLAAASWRNRIAVPLDFRPVDTACRIGSDERRLAGSELAVSALVSWQPRLCANPASPPYSYTSLSDDQARSQLIGGGTGAAGMAMVSRPVDTGGLDPDDPVVYAPLALSAVVVGFNLERDPRINTTTGKAVNPDEDPLAGTRVASINLTPRLVAKMLTESYHSTLGSYAPPYPWVEKNPFSLIADPDFVQFNPEFADLNPLSLAGKMALELPTSDATYEVWRWVLSDPEARQWMAGAPDPWGTTVNPVYSTDRAVNPTGVAFGDPIPTNFPKSEPYCYQSPTPLLLADMKLPRPLCILDQAPYLGSMVEAASATRTANDGNRTTPDINAVSPDAAWVKSGPQVPGHRAMLSITDAASATRFGLQIAHLSRAGDDGAGRSFVAPDAAGLLAGQTSMKASAAADVLQPDPAATTAGAYPLPMLVYGAARPAVLDAPARDDYAAFITYAVGDGQVPGLEAGQLPPGYAPLPDGLRQQATAAAARIKAGVPAQENPAPTTDNAAPASSVPAAAATTASPAAPDAAAAAAPAASGGSSGGDTGTSGVPSASGSGSGGGGGGSDGPGQPPPAAPSSGVDLAAGAGPRAVTPALAAGAVRLVLPLVLALGLCSGLAVLMLDDRWQQKVLAPIRRSPK